MSHAQYIFEAEVERLMREVLYEESPAPHIENDVAGSQPADADARRSPFTPITPAVRVRPAYLFPQIPGHDIFFFESDLPEYDYFTREPEIFALAPHHLWSEQKFSAMMRVVNTETGVTAVAVWLNAEQIERLNDAMLWDFNAVASQDS